MIDLQNSNIYKEIATSIQGEEAIFHSVLLELKKIDKTDLHEFLNKVLDVVANALNIERVSIWFFNEDRNCIYCDYMYLRKFGSYTNETTLQVKDYPNYFNAIETQLYVAADDAVNDPQTKELAESYLIPRGVFSMMDIPIHFRGQTIGIICHEEQDTPRKWKREEMDFTAAISSLVSTSLEIDFRKTKEQDFHESQRFLSTLISNLPGYVYRVKKTGDSWSIQYTSDGVFELTGYRPQELIDNIVFYNSMMIYENDKLIAKKAIGEALSAKKSYQISYRIKTASGEIKWVWEQGRGIYADSGELTATEGFITDITEKKLFEEEILKKNNELAELNEFGKSLSKLAEPDEISEILGLMLGRLFETNSITISLYDEEVNFLTFPYCSINGTRMKAEGREFENGLTEYIISSKKTLLLNENVDLSLESLGIVRDDTGSLSLLASPMIAGEKVLGAITLQVNNGNHKFTESQSELLATVASQAAIALENANLYHEVTRSLRDKEILLQEVHHRVKNNLQIMSSLIKLQTQFLKDEKMLEIMKETGGRIQSMAIVHTKLYNTKDYEKINFSEYVKSLTDNFINSYGFKVKNMRFDIDIIDVVLNIDTAIPCGLIINELVSNAIKYAFPNGIGVITISMKLESGSKYILTVKDNGAGTNKNIDLYKADTLGLQLVSLLSKQLNGTVSMNTGVNAGFEFVLIFEEAYYKSRK
ncbi:MAG: GAF domain-containing protein [Ignavibacteria bacterium]|nr:GAF domain-containing protein [Ignavibacteria bacterium]